MLGRTESAVGSSSEPGTGFRGRKAGVIRDAFADRVFPGRKRALDPVDLFRGDDTRDELDFGAASAGTIGQPENLLSRIEF
jgi:hypothetical protein